MTENTLKSGVIREEFYRLTGDFYQAMVLDYLYQNSDLKDPHRWIRKTIDTIVEDLMNPCERKSMIHILKKLSNRGWLKIRSNPDDPMDKTKQYSLDLFKIKEDLLTLGLRLPTQNISHLLF